MAAAAQPKGVYGTPSATCACQGFVPQLYRPALCAMCFKSIADHFDEWSVVPDTKPPTYIHCETGETMGARANEAAVAKYQASIRAASSSQPQNAASSRDLLKGVAHKAIAEINSKIALNDAEPVDDDATRRHSFQRGKLAPNVVNAEDVGETPHVAEAGGEVSHETPTAERIDQLSSLDVVVEEDDEDEGTNVGGQSDTDAQAEASTGADAAVGALVPAEEPAQPPPTDAGVVAPPAAPAFCIPEEQHAPPPVEEYQHAQPDTQGEQAPAPPSATATATAAPVTETAPQQAPVSVRGQAQPQAAPAAGDAQLAQGAPQPQPQRATVVRRAGPTAQRKASVKPPALPAPEAAALAWLNDNTPPIPQLAARARSFDNAPWMLQSVPSFGEGVDTVHTPDKYTLFAVRQALAEDATGKVKQNSALVPRVLRVGPHSVAAISAPPLHPNRGALQWERTLHSLKYVGVQSWSSIVQGGAVQRLRSLSGADAGAAGAAAAVASGTATAARTTERDSSGPADCLVLCFGPEPSGLQFLTRAGSARNGPPVCREGVEVRSGNLRKKKQHSEGTWKATASGVLGAVTRRRGSVSRGGGEGLGYNWKQRWATLHTTEMLYFASQAAQGTARELHEKGAQLMAAAEDADSMKSGAKMLSDAAGMTQGRIELNGTVDVLPYFPEDEPPEFDGDTPVTAAISVRTAGTHHYLQLQTPGEAVEWMSSILACTHSAGQRLPLQVHVLRCSSPEQASAAAQQITTAQRALPQADTVAQMRLAQRLAWEMSPSYATLMRLDVTDGVVRELSQAASVAPSTALRLLHSTGGQSGMIREASARMHSVVGGDGQYVAARIQWQYVDDFDDLQGPFYEAQMREWVQQGWFKESTMARCITPVLGVDYSATAAAGAGQQGRTMLMAIGDLFPDGMRSAFDGSGAWISAYNLSAQYQRLVVSAMGLGLPPSRVMASLQLMRSNTLPPDLGLLMDLMPKGTAEESTQ